jgi:nitrite reductase/ring-hydroxylating ferredoxin subunit
MMASEDHPLSKGSWRDAGTLDALLAGQMRRIELAGQQILIANVAGTLLAVADTCTHEDASLSMGALDGENVRCPLHGSRFCLRDGRALEEPAEIGLACFAVRVNQNQLQLYLPDTTSTEINEGGQHER